jgi:hypothetical protein
MNSRTEISKAVTREEEKIFPHLIIKMARHLQLPDEL